MLCRNVAHRGVCCVKSSHTYSVIRLRLSSRCAFFVVRVLAIRRRTSKLKQILTQQVCSFLRVSDSLLWRVCSASTWDLRHAQQERLDTPNAVVEPGRNYQPFTTLSVDHGSSIEKFNLSLYTKGFINELDAATLSVVSQYVSPTPCVWGRERIIASYHGVNTVPICWIAKVKFKRIQRIVRGG